MRDQASSLRALKANFDKIVAKEKAETTEEFLTKIRRASPLSAYILIYLDSVKSEYPDIDLWLYNLSDEPSKLYLWDQANLISHKILTNKNSNLLSFPVLPKQMAMLDLNGKTDNERFEFLKNISNTLDKHSEVWITIKASEISYYKYLLESTNTLCIMLPDKEEAIVKGYEVVKKIHTLDLTSPVSLLEFSSKSFCNQPYKSLKIKNVAKQFLGIDLYLAGVVLSNNKYFSMINEGNQVGMKSIINKENNDFICTFCENIVNLRLGTY